MRIVPQASLLCHIHPAMLPPALRYTCSCCTCHAYSPATPTNPSTLSDVLLLSAVADTMERPVARTLPTSASTLPTRKCRQAPLSATRVACLRTLTTATERILMPTMLPLGSQSGLRPLAPLQPHFRESWRATRCWQRAKTYLPCQHRGDPGQLHTMMRTRA
jgi:hypothetical protein